MIHISDLLEKKLGLQFHACTILYVQWTLYKSKTNIPIPLLLLLPAGLLPPGVLLRLRRHPLLLNTNINLKLISKIMFFFMVIYELIIFVRQTKVQFLIQNSISLSFCLIFFVSFLWFCLIFYYPNPYPYPGDRNETYPDP